MLALILLIPSGISLSINGFETYVQENQSEIVEDGETVEFRLNTTESLNASIEILDDSQNLQLSDEMTLIQNSSSYQIYSLNYTLNTSQSGYWEATATANDSNSTLEESIAFLAGTDQPFFINQTENPSYAEQGSNVTVKATILDTEEDIETVNITFDNSSREYPMNRTTVDDSIHWYEKEIPAWKEGKINYEVTAEDSSGLTAQESNFFEVFGEPESTNISVKVAPVCQSSLDYYLVPGDGKIVQNNTGVFVEIISNTGNIKSNITVDYLNVTYQDNNPYSRGEPKGPVVESYDGELFENTLLGESVTYFKLFTAQYDLGNYTGHSSISTDCKTDGTENEDFQKSTLNESYQCGNLSASRFGCHNLSVVDTTQVAQQTASVNLSARSNKTVDEQVEDTEAYQGTQSLNGTEYNFYSFNGTSTGEYDYLCATDNSTIEEAGECAYETDIISAYSLEVQKVPYDGSNATVSLLSENKDYLNTSLSCESESDTQAVCNSTLSFFEKFSFFGNFEIVEEIGEGGVNESGNQTSDQSVPGDNDEPGETEVTEPTPTPTPTPEPELSLNIDPQKDVYEAPQGLFTQTGLNITNRGNVEISNITLEPQVRSLGDGWESQDGQIGSIEVNETLQRDVFVRPPEDATPGKYIVPVTASTPERRLDIDYFQLEVKKTEFVPQLLIGEAARDVTIPVNTNETFPILVENSGRVNITNVTAGVQNLDDCGVSSSESLGLLRPNETRSLDLTISSQDNLGQCNSTLIVSSSEGAYGFSNIQVTTTPEEGLIPSEQRIPTIGVLWTLLLALYAFVTRKYSLDSPTVRWPFLFIILGEVVIILYTIVNYYSLPLASFLPF